MIHTSARLRRNHQNSFASTTCGLLTVWIRMGAIPEAACLIFIPSKIAVAAGKLSALAYANVLSLFHCHESYSCFHTMVITTSAWDAASVRISRFSSYDPSIALTPSVCSFSALSTERTSAVNSKDEAFGWLKRRVRTLPPMKPRCKDKLKDGCNVWHCHSNLLLR